MEVPAMLFDHRDFFRAGVQGLNSLEYSEAALVLSYR
jgi:hypothetical protein